jgi:hypothetical protein
MKNGQTVFSKLLLENTFSPFDQIQMKLRRTPSPFEALKRKYNMSPSERLRTLTELGVEERQLFPG